MSQPVDVQIACPFSGTGQAFPHVLQLDVLLLRSTHTPEHGVRPPVQVVAHTPPEQTSFAGHALPHFPQFPGSVLVSTQALPHRAPDRQTKSQPGEVQVGAAYAGALHCVEQLPQ